jgi:DNA-binding transcriptional LysR family regulator
MHRADLTQESYACLLRRGHPLAEGRLSMENYLNLSHIHVSARRHGLGHIDRVLAELGLHRRIKARIRNPGVAAEIVRQTDLAMTMPERFAAYYQLAAVPLPFEVPSLAWQLYWPTRLDTDSGNLWLRQQILEIARKYTGTAPSARRENERGKTKYD